MKNRRSEVLFRDDYKELAEVAMFVLGETPPLGKFSWKSLEPATRQDFVPLAFTVLKPRLFLSSWS